MAADLIFSIIATVLSVIAFVASLAQFLISRSDQFAGAAEQRLQALEVRYAEVAQPAMAQLDAIKTLHPSDALWTALQFQPAPAALPEANDDAAAAAAKQQLRAAQMELLVAEQRARNAAKGFWDDTLRAMEQGKLPSSFGVARQLTKHCYSLTFKDKRWVYRANNFRELVEPFDIANYYRLELDRYSGHYLDGKRPKTYTRLEGMWQRHCAAQSPPALEYNSSLAWAEAVEGVNRAPPDVDAPLQRLPLLVLPTGSLPLKRAAVSR